MNWTWRRAGNALLDAAFLTLGWIVVDLVLGITHDYVLVFILSAGGSWSGQTPWMKP